MRHSEYLRRLKKRMRENDLVEFVPSVDVESPLVEIRTPETRKAFANIMRKAGFTETQIEKRLQELSPAEGTIRHFG